MVKNIQEERWRWIKSIINKELKLQDVVRVCPHSERSLKRWCALYRQHGESGLSPRSTQPKTSPEETAIWIKERVIEKRKETKLCAQKIHWKLKKEGLLIPVRTIGKILKTEGLTRQYRVKKIKYKYLRAERQPGDLVEIDVKHVPGPIAGHKYYQYTSIDTASRWRHLAVYDEECTYHSIRFLQEVQEVIGRFPHAIKAIKTDNHSTFTNYYIGTNKRSDMTVKTLHGLDKFCAERGIVHYLINPGRPAENGTVERSHREDQEKFYDQNKFRNFADLKRKIELWNNYYNNLEHCGLKGKTPNEALREGRTVNIKG